MALTKVGKEGVTGISNSSNATAITIDSSENVGIGTASPDSLVHLSGANPKLHIRNSSDSNRGGYLQDNGSTFVLGSNSGVRNLVFSPDNTERMRIDSSGRVTMPNQPAFQVHKNGTEQSNIAADNSTVAVTFSTEAFDLGGNFASNTFTAPVTGKYLMALKLRFNNVDTASQYYIARVITSNSEYHNIYDSDDDAGGDLEYLTLQVTQLVDMDANDTATVGVTQQGGTQQTDINGGRVYTSFSGYLVA